MKKLLRTAWAAILVVFVIRILDWLLSPALPMLMALAVVGLALYIVVVGRRAL